MPVYVQMNTGLLNRIIRHLHIVPLSAEASLIELNRCRFTHVRCFSSNVSRSGAVPRFTTEMGTCSDGERKPSGKILVQYASSLGFCTACRIQGSACRRLFIMAAIIVLLGIQTHMALVMSSFVQ